MSDTAIGLTDTGGLEIAAVPCLSDNYAYIARVKDTGEVFVVDVPEAAPVIEALSSLGWTLTHILLTHHHSDHVAGVEELRLRSGAKVYGNAADAARLPKLDFAVEAGGAFDLAGRSISVIDTPGHTVGHIAFHSAQDAVLFSGDTLFAMGCGRLFEGTAAQMWGGLSELAALPEDTLVFFGHEYTANNADFALDVDSDNLALRARIKDMIAALRAVGRSTPSSIGLERATNPFLRATDPVVAAKVGLPGADGATVFAELRRRKDRK